MKMLSILTLCVVLLLGTSCTGDKKVSSTTTAGTSKKLTTTTKTSSRDTTTIKKSESTLKSKKVTQTEFENKMADIAEDALGEYVRKSAVRAYGLCVGKKSYPLISQQTIDIIMSYKSISDIDDLAANSDDDSILNQAGDDCQYLAQEGEL